MARSVLDFYNIVTGFRLLTLFFIIVLILHYYILIILIDFQVMIGNIKF